MKTTAVSVCLGLLIIAGCGKPESTTTQPSASAPTNIIFWHAMSDQKAEALREIIDRYNRSNPPMTVKEEFVGNYDDLHKKNMAALMAKRSPDLTMAYESMVAEYMKYQAVADLTPYLEQQAKTTDILQDIYPTFLHSNRYPAFGNKLLSMPFTKSILMQYYNLDMLKEIGKDTPPATWDEFLADCRAIKAKKGISPLAFSRDASTFDGLVFSFGGEVYDPKTNSPLFNQPPTIQSLALIRTLFDEGLAHEIAYNTFDDRTDFAEARSAFFIRSSTSRPYVQAFIKDKFRWGMSVIPQGGEKHSPRTVLFGANVCVFKSTDARQRAAWKFIEYFLSKDVTALWATRTGYLPVRKSALSVPMLKEFLQKHPTNQQTVEAIPYANPEPSVKGWQAVRTEIERAISNVIAKRQTPEQAAQSLQTQAARQLER